MRDENVYNSWKDLFSLNDCYHNCQIYNKIMLRHGQSYCLNDTLSKNAHKALHSHTLLQCNKYFSTINQNFI